MYAASATDTAVMSSGASSVSTEYVSLQSAGASYHTSAQSKHHQGKGYHPMNRTTTDTMNNYQAVDIGGHESLGYTASLPRNTIYKQSYEEPINNELIDPRQYQVGARESILPPPASVHSGSMRSASDHIADGLAKHNIRKSDEVPYRDSITHNGSLYGGDPLRGVEFDENFPRENHQFVPESFQPHNTMNYYNQPMSPSQYYTNTKQNDFV